VSDRTSESDRIVIGVDPHKASWTAAAVGPGLRPLATIRVPVDPQDYRDLRCFAARWPAAVWAIEGAGHYGAGLTRFLGDRGEMVLEVHKGQLVRLERPAAAVFVADPELADVQAHSPTLVYVFGRRSGTTTLFAVDANERVLLRRSSF